MPAHPRLRPPTDVLETLRRSNDCSRITRVPLNGGGELFFTQIVADAYEEALRMTRFGARFVVEDRLAGVAYGILFRIRASWEPPTAEVFYDWCDSVSAEVAELGRWILDSGGFEGLFDAGDVLAIDAYEFLPHVGTETQRTALRNMASELKRCFRRLARAVVTVHPHHLGEPPEVDSGARKVTAYRRALEKLLVDISDLRLGACLNPKAPTDDLLVIRGRSIGPAEELLELLKRTRLRPT